MSVATAAATVAAAAAARPFAATPASGSASFHKSPGAQPAPAFQASPGLAAAVPTSARAHPAVAPSPFPPLSALAASPGAPSLGQPGYFGLEAPLRL